MKKQHDFIIIPLHIYPFDVLVSRQSTKDLTAKLKTLLPEDVHHEIEEAIAKDKGRTTMFSSGQSVIHLLDFNSGIIAHEVFHVVDFLMTRLEMPLVHENQEAYAYLLGYIVEKIHLWIDE